MAEQIKYISEEKLALYNANVKATYATKTELLNKVDKVDGKGLSTNDYTDDDKRQVAKIDGLIANGGEPNTIDVIKVDGVVITPVEKVVNIELPNDNTIEVVKVNGTVVTPVEKVVDITVPDVSDIELDITQLQNDVAALPTEAEVDDKIEAATLDMATNAGVDTKIAAATADFVSETDIDDKISTALADITGIDFKVVDTLPATGVAGTIYLLSNSGAGNNAYDEYVYINKGTTEEPNMVFEKIGTTEVDLSDYVKKSDLVEASDDFINGLFE